jgi:hypothetical protein
MSTFTNRIGHDNFVWWLGVVEDRMDPLNLGRVRVRIFGWHTDDLNLIPTSSLPWALPMYPPNNSKTFSAPEEGNYVMGFFTDGLSGQAPVLMGVFPGIAQSAPQKGIGFSADTKYFNSKVTYDPKPKSIAQYPDNKYIKTGAGGKTTIASTTAPAMANERIGKSTIAASAQGDYQGTPQQINDDNLAHVCDIHNKIRYDIAIKKLENLGIFQAIRKAIEALTSGTSGSPLATQIQQAIKVIRAFIKMVQEVVDFIKDVVAEIAKFIAWVKKMIQYILSLPAKLVALLVNCLNELKSALIGAVSDALGGGSGSTSQIGADTMKLVNEITKVANDAKTVAQDTVNTVTSVQTVIPANPKFQMA